MAYLRSFQPSAFLLLSAALLLGGCCANNVCNPDDPLADAVKLRFSRAFTVSDLDTVIVQRYPKHFTANTTPETVILVRTPVQAYDSVLINNSTPFARVGTTNLGAYRYVVAYLTHPAGSKPVPAVALVLDSLHVRGTFAGTSCCTNYANQEKTVFAKDSVFDLKQQPFLKITK